MEKETKVTEPVMTVDYFDEMNAKSERVEFKLSEIDNLKKVEKADSNLNLTAFYSVKLKNGHSYDINEAFYYLIHTQYKNKPDNYSLEELD